MASSATANFSKIASTFLNSTNSRSEVGLWLQNQKADRAVYLQTPNKKIILRDFAYFQKSIFVFNFVVTGTIKPVHLRTSKSYLKNIIHLTPHIT